MRTRDAAISTFYGASVRDGRSSLRTATFDAASVRAAALRALSRARDADDESHPGAKFVQAGCKFLHDDLHADCGAAAVHYSGKPLSMDDAGEVMTGLGYEMTGRTAVGATYEHPEKSGGITLVPRAESAKDRRARDDGEVGMTGTSSGVTPDTGGYGGYGGAGFMGSMERDSTVGASVASEGG